MAVENFRRAVGNLLRRAANDHHRAALLHVRGVKLLFANIIWLLAGRVADVSVFKRTTHTE